MTPPAAAWLQGYADGGTNLERSDVRPAKEHHNHTEARRWFELEREDCEMCKRHCIKNPKQRLLMRCASELHVLAFLRIMRLRGWCPVRSHKPDVVRSIRTAAPITRVVQWQDGGLQNRRPGFDSPPSCL